MKSSINRFVTWCIDLVANWLYELGRPKRRCVVTEIKSDWGLKQALKEKIKENPNDSKFQLTGTIFAEKNEMGNWYFYTTMY